MKLWWIDGGKRRERVDLNGGGSASELGGNCYGITSNAYSGANGAVAIDNSGNVWTAGNARRRAKSPSIWVEASGSPELATTA